MSAGCQLTLGDVTTDSPTSITAALRSVAVAFGALGPSLIDAGVMAREGVAPGSGGVREIAPEGPQAIGADGALDRAALAQIVFAGEDARGRLNAPRHPPVRALGAKRNA